MSNLQNILNLSLEQVVGDRFGRYSKYIIQDRALPDARDGLKPVQRRILYAMHTEGNLFDRAYRKSAKTVGVVIGNYHPHGDSSVYEAMVRLSQEWKLRYPLIDMQGNNGSIDGDSAAAMRYTEARLSKVSSLILDGINKQTVDYTLNFDDTTEEPLVLPSLLPNLLMNGSTGISAGYATEIPPHHAGEVLDAAIGRISGTVQNVDDLLTHMQGPDFPTGGVVQGLDGIKKAFETGRGKVIIRSRSTIETLRGGRQQIVITELPYEVNKANLVKRMEELRLDKKVEGVAEVRDETDRDGLRVVIELKKEADAEGVLHFYLKQTDLQIAYNYNMVAIHERTPRQMGVLTLLDAYLAHVKEVVIRRTAFDLEQAKRRQEVVSALMTAISVLDETLALIRSASNKADAKEKLIARFNFTDRQAEAVVMLQLYRLTNTDIVELQEEAAKLEKEIARLEKILNDEKTRNRLIIKELTVLKEQVADKRRSTIEAEVEELKLKTEVMIAVEETMVFLSKNGYVKRSSLRSFGASNDLPDLKEQDRPLLQGQAMTTDHLIVWTVRGNYLLIPVHQLPDTKWKDGGQHVANLVPLEPGDRVLSADLVRSFDEAQHCLFVTRQGMVKRSKLSDYNAQRKSKPLQGVRLKADDEVLYAQVSTGQTELFLATQNGFGLWFTEDDVPVVGVRAAGVKAINLKDQDVVAGAIGFKEAPQIVLLTQRGALKKMRLADQFQVSSRALRGLQLLRDLKSKPHQVAALIDVTQAKELVLSGKEQEKTIQIGSLSFLDRLSNGSFAYDEEKFGPLLDWYTR
ncbi:DNA gyrase subunit A [Exiguobacterium indicum]|uniref:DNA topoisomerase 4 subunit A n=4 Tax=Exiguobacterium TaxID=33986 RepID=A0A0V8GCF6_9BACL|nr:MULTISPECIES: DNA topoisomerase IV subunit A [Exiguobacterium]AOT00703.1 DNA topoisomerase IV subunit A [Exiguobacterium sp. U13-1]KSU47984.1 DNA gyrase subunit A [Exiguobacterium enclense]KTR27747.1 DNA gyrase subunit A [Exiguobacterium indicum]KTR62609.1 DNA gyrase subunit A [Exiguobacterium indicum]MCQ4090274.1 DNA topoisomerase IV subunit A [Exiguobacterium sp. LL15]